MRLLLVVLVLALIAVVFAADVVVTNATTVGEEEADIHVRR
jgi:Ca2+/Na+ antiporter